MQTLFLFLVFVFVLFLLQQSAGTSSLDTWTSTQSPLSGVAAQVSIFQVLLDYGKLKGVGASLQAAGSPTTHTRVCLPIAQCTGGGDSPGSLGV